MSLTPKPTLSTAISRRITLLRFPLIVGVVFIHAYGMSAAFRDGVAGTDAASPLVATIQDLVSQVIARVSVPLFFAMSAFLLFHGMSGGWAEWRRKWQSRGRTLLVPYLLWNSVVLLFILAARRVPWSAVYFSTAKGDPLAAGFVSMAGAAFGVTDYPIAYQFWFIRDLMVLVFAAPLLWFLLRHRFTACAAVGVAAAWWIGWPKAIFVPAPEAAVFFLLGGAFGVGALPVRWLEWSSWWLLPVFGVCAVADMLVTDFARGSVYHLVTVAVGAAAVWAAAGCIPASAWISRWLTRLSADSFFVFAAHEPLLTILKKTTFRLAHPASGSLILAVYILVPVVTIVICLLVGRLLAVRVPGLMAVLTGSREKNLAGLPGN